MAACVYLSVLSALSLRAAGAAPEEGVRSIPAVRTAAPPVIDGRLDERCWEDASVATGFTEHKTERAAEEQTIVRILYDDANVYVGFECIEPHPEKIQATERKYDRVLWGDDWLEVQFDTFHDHSGRYIFVLNPLGTRYDARIDVFGWNTSWDCNWSAACTVGEDRWFAECAIPIGELHFLRGNDVTWGINLHRSEKGEQEGSTWSFYKTEVYAPRHMGHLTGLDLSGVVVNRRPQLETYVSATARTEGGEDDASTGLDVSLRLTPRLITAFTVNPDFGQVEADTDTIELRDTERFLPERRPFFREGAELFETPINVYYSRRIWDIDAGAKITGVSPGWSLGLLDVEGEIVRDDARCDGNFLVGRLMRKFGEGSHIGAMAVNSERINGFNRVGGVDAHLRLNDNCTWTSQILGMQGEEEVVTTDEDGHETRETVRRNEYAAESSLDWWKRPLYWGVAVEDVSEEFRPDLGYVPRQDIRGGTAYIEVINDIEEGPAKWYGAGTYFTVYENHHGETTLRDFHHWIGVDLRSEFYFQVWRDDRFHAPFNNHETGIWVGYNVLDPWHSVEGSYKHGVFEETDYDEFSLTKPMKVGERMTTTLTGNYRLEYPKGDDEDGKPLDDRTVWLWRWVTEYTFRWNARVKFTVEDTNQDRHNVTLLFSWFPRKDVDLYVVLTDSQSEDEEEQALFAKVVRRF